MRCTNGWMRVGFVFAIAVGAINDLSHGDDHFLTIGGGYAPSGNQVSLEKNVLLFQRFMSEREAGQSGAARPRVDVLFADGNDPAKDVQVMEIESVPEANRWMAELFGSTTDLGLAYRDHQVPNVRGSSSAKNVRGWFKEASDRIKAGDRLFIYVTAHGTPSLDSNRDRDTEIALWDYSSIKMTEFTALLDRLPDDIDVVVVMVQCYAGGFARYCFVDGDPDQGLAKQRRVGFFATVHDRPAAGCTSDVDEVNYVEYSTYFWAAVRGIDRSGAPIDPPDYDGDGKIGFDEAHAYTVLNAITIDIPLTTSSEFLSVNSRFAGDRESDDEFDLLSEDEPYSSVVSLAAPAQRVVLEGLSTLLQLDGEDRIKTAQEASRPQRRRRGSGGRRSNDELRTLRDRIADDLLERWPELSNVMNPKAIELVTSRADEFVEAVHGHRKFERFSELLEANVTEMSSEERRAMHRRYVRVANDIVLAENLRRLGDRKTIAQFGSLIKAESGSL
ncbi:hypothetical protein Poly51_47650 [Rubripirellula tenax]|uniref:Caspase domain protein n=1 Tax=Rubripirellula tenax TaxID=2528015 RepID=A0A5C6EMJ5_9BACT|nr:hypothetical protein [Rubripirellula tenax]TWU48861.1 hypothetical protein Poly51_47650 [Rubripirellula tenax]